jgi:hypothetical protein
MDTKDTTKDIKREEASPTKMVMRERLRSTTINPFSNSKSRKVSVDKRDTTYTDRDRMVTRTTSFDVTDRHTLEWQE